MAGERYEWDEAKRVESLQKHGVDFADAWRLDWALAIVNTDYRFPYGEARYVAHAPLYGRLHALVFTLRNDTHRVISFRRANRREQAEYATAILARLARR